MSRQQKMMHSWCLQPQRQQHTLLPVLLGLKVLLVLQLQLRPENVPS
jgi:hypothetical protein